MDFYRWFENQKRMGRFPKYSTDLVKGFEKHGYKPEKYGEGYRIVPIEPGEQRDRDQLGKSQGRGESSRAWGAQVAPESIPGPSSLAGVDLNRASGYWENAGAQSDAMMTDGQVNHPQELDLAAWNRDFRDSMDFFDGPPGVAPDSFGDHAGSAVLSYPTNGFVQEVPIVPVNPNGGFENQWGYVAFPVESQDDFGQPSTSMEYGQPGVVFSPSSLFYNPIGNAASGNLPPHSPANRPETPTAWQRTPVQGLEEGLEWIIRELRRQQARRTSRQGNAR
ncbi:hypothetical protein [Streptomyces sp. NPDC006012]|uniref:hypothetical protein n=1 Tax=Streptomyces sp. NPDC006012 TaxID=3364739 RepID=UPI0036ABA711